MCVCVCVFTCVFPQVLILLQASGHGDVSVMAGLHGLWLAGLCITLCVSAVSIGVRSRLRVCVCDTWLVNYPRDFLQLRTLCVLCVLACLRLPPLYVCVCA